MPRIPIIEQPQSRVSLSGISLPQQPAGSDIVQQSMSEFRQSLEKTKTILDKIEYEKNVAKAHDTIYKFNDAARQKYSELKSLHGGDASEIVDQYKTWYEDSIYSFESNLIGNTQQKIFKDAAESRRARDLDSLAAHQINEHQKYIESIYQSSISNAQKDAVLYSDDPLRIEKIIGDTVIWVDAANPGQDNSAAKHMISDTLMITAIQDQTDRNPQKAKAMIERWKTQLGEKYNQVSEEVDKEFLYFEATTRFEKDNFDQQYDWVKSIKGIDEDVKRAVMSRINSDEAEYEERERESVNARQKNVKANNLETWRLFRNGKLSAAQLDQKAKNQEIDTTTYNGIYREMKNPTINNNPVVVGELAEKVALGQDITEDLEQARMRGEITVESYITLKTNSTKDEFKTALNYINAAIKLPEFYYNQDKQLKYAEAVKSFNQRVAAGENPMRVADEIVKNNTSEIRRSMIGIASPTYLTGEKDDLDALNNAIVETANAFHRGDIKTIDEYRYQMSNIQQLIDLAIENQQSNEQSQGFQEAIKATQRLND